ncbi:putative membrane protein (plasmid) [Rhizobium favelukesii]|uniref:Membrane protein n=2 Tax=Rhizobium/Agrobacterium group TaxID=227290 RepID=W6S5K6_9HYPH|nr:putative membrane protein [Rhizobium favelukesii]
MFLQSGDKRMSDVSDEIVSGLHLVVVAQAIAWLLFALIFFVTIAPIRLRPRTITRVNLDRSLAFAAMAFFFVLGYSHSAALVGVSCVIGAGISELLQLLSPSRHARLPDAMAKSTGAAAGALVAMVALATSGSLAI